MPNQEQASNPQPFEQDQEGEQEPTTSQDQAQDEVHDLDHSREEFVGHDGLVRRIKASSKSSDMQVNKILGSISKVVVTRRKISSLTTFCQHHAFVSYFEPRIGS